MSRGRYGECGILVERGGVLEEDEASWTRVSFILALY